MNLRIIIRRFLLWLADAFAEENSPATSHNTAFPSDFFAAFVPLEFATDSELSRRARLIVGFGFLGAIFGAAYTVFYFAIGHHWGAAIVIACSCGMTVTPFLLRRTRSVKLCGNLMTAILAFGFIALSAVEGGVRGHAVAWLATVPLCALLLVNRRAALASSAACVAATLCFVLLDEQGVVVPILYPARWHHTVTAVGFLSLPIFMTFLGVIFETGRHRAFRKMEDALGDLSQANQRLLQADREKNQFLGMVTHDLKNPLSVIFGFSKLLAPKVGESLPTESASVNFIVRAAERMMQMIEQLLDVNAIEEGRFPLNLEPCDLSAISDEVVVAFRRVAEEKKIVLHEEQEHDSLWVHADEKAVRQILENLLSNAVKYSPQGSEVFVRLSRSPHGVSWEVRDPGAGLSVKDQAKLFQKFSKLSTRPTAGESSTGLGLSIVKKLSVAMGGDVRCKSAPGEGSTFSFHMPESAPVTFDGDSSPHESEVVGAKNCG
jgi:signal transduction histidine kinase